MLRRLGLLLLGFLFAAPSSVWPASGTEGASFLDIPVGGAPAALGSAYTAQATDVYAPVWNPAGLGYLHSLEFTGMYTNYVSPVYYGHAGLVMPLGKEDQDGARPAGLGASIQYLGTSAIDAYTEDNKPAGSFTSAFVAYSLAYGQKLTDSLSAGATAKLITEKISDATASTYASDLGLLYKPTSKLSLGAVAANIGPGIKFANESDPLPLAARLGATYQIRPQWDLSAEGVYRRTGLLSESMGMEWRYGEIFSFRGGYNTAHTKELGLATGFTAGIGLFYWGQEFSFAWVPMGDLGQTLYLSLVFRWNTKARPERPRLKPAEDSELEDYNDSGRYHDIFDFLNSDERKSVK